MYQLTITLTTINNTPIPQAEVSGRGLTGIVYKRLLHGEHWAKREVDWLHDDQPRPYSMMPIFTNHQLTGIRFGIVSDRAFVLLHNAWQQAIQKGMLLSLGSYRLVATYMDCQQGRGFAELSENEGAGAMNLRFLTPTAFKQGDDAKGKPMLLLLPAPRNVFTSAFKAWQAFAPPPQKLPEAWLTWCERHILVSRHAIQTDTFAVKHKQIHLGFVGDVWFEARDEDMMSRQIWQALGQFAPYCGIGVKTAMGLGAVDYRRR